MKINERGYWENPTDIGHVHDKRLCDGIINLLKQNNIKTVVDFGCGKGNYASSIIQSGVYCEAYDGNPNTPELSNGLGKVLDLSMNFNLDKKFDCVISLEVGEHIPKEYEKIFIDNICSHTTNLLILSWAIVGQGGDGHLNCQNNDYIIDQMESRNFIYLEKDSTELRGYTSNAGWFKNTLMIFKKI
jgi:cyclopropane fatty-acyl-phospholipid synthase-like methyltransferase